MDDVSPFSVERAVVLKTLLFSPSCGWPIWTALAAGLLLVCMGCCYDVRYVVLGLMLCVAILPGIVAFIYFSRTLAPDMVPNILPHTLERCDEGFLVRIWRQEPDEGSEQEPPMEQAEYPADGPLWVQSGLISLSDKKIVSRKTTVGYDVFYFKESPMKILYVPRY